MNSPFFKAESFAVNRQVQTSSSVSILGSTISPNTVFRRIVSIIIFAFKHQLWRTWSHIRNEICKIHPAIANGNASTSIIFVSLITWIKASLSHSAPSIVFARSFIIASVAMFNFTKLYVFAFSTSTTFGFASPQLIRIHRPFFTAIAMTLPTFKRYKMRYSPIAESDTFQFIFRHNAKHIINQIIRKRNVTA